MMFGAMSAELVVPSAFMRCVYMQHILPDRSRGFLSPLQGCRSPASWSSIYLGLRPLLVVYMMLPCASLSACHQQESRLLEQVMPIGSLRVAPLSRLRTAEPLCTSQPLP